MSIDMPTHQSSLHQLAPSPEQVVVPQTPESVDSQNTFEPGAILDQAREVVRQQAGAVDQSGADADTFLGEVESIYRSYDDLHNQLKDLTAQYKDNVTHLTTLHDRYVGLVANFRQTKQQIAGTEADIKEKTAMLALTSKEAESDEKSARGAIEMVGDEGADLNTRIMLAEQHYQQAPDLKPGSYSSLYRSFESGLKKEIQDCEKKLSELVHQKFALKSNIGTTERDFLQLDERNQELANHIAHVTQRIKEYGLLDRLKNDLLAARLIDYTFSGENGGDKDVT